MTFKPLLAATLDLNDDIDRVTFPVLCSPKLDGVRAIIRGGVVMSRSMKPIRNRHVQKLFGRPELEGLDGELIVGNPTDPNLMQQTTSGVMSADGEPDVRFYVFDKVDAKGGFAERLQQARNIVTDLESRIPLVMVPHDKASSAADIAILESAFVEQGYEGMMVRSVDGPYKQGRSTLREGTLLKVKRFTDGEAVVIGFEELETNLNEAFKDELGHTKRSSSKEGKVGAGKLGNFLVRELKTGVEFSIGSGLDMALRERLWAEQDTLVDRIVKYKSFQVAGVKEAPRFPIFIGFRDPSDM
jgi:DNA ligase-1